MIVVRHENGNLDLTYMCILFLIGVPGLLAAMFGTWQGASGIAVAGLALMFASVLYYFHVITRLSTLIPRVKLKQTCNN
jgi:hypothetical protein